MGRQFQNALKLDEISAKLVESLQSIRTSSKPVQKLGKTIEKEPRAGASYRIVCSFFGRRRPAPAGRRFATRPWLRRGGRENQLCRGARLADAATRARKEPANGEAALGVRGRGPTGHESRAKNRPGARLAHVRRRWRTAAD